MTIITHDSTRGPGSVLLCVSTVLSLYLANSARFSAGWLQFWERSSGLVIGGHSLNLRSLVNEGFMSLFFFSVGLEIKKEIVDGSLASIKGALLPCIAALGGMVVPMALYLVVNLILPGGSLAGLTIPMATDIAFAMGIYNFFRNRMPTSVSTFLLTLATVDDLGAIAVIATCFAQSICLPFLGLAALAQITLVAMGRKRIRSGKSYLVAGVSLWYCLLRAGVNADIAGVLAALCVPAG